MVADKTAKIDTTNVINSNWIGNSGTAEDGDAVVVGVGVSIDIGVGFEVGVGVGEGVGVGAGFTATETVLDVGEVIEVEALSVTLHATKCEVPAALYR
jgi:hypothetical protein